MNEQGSGPEGVDDLCFHTYGKFLLLLLLRSSPASPTQILAFRGKILPILGLEAGGGGAEKEKKEEKIPHTCESIGHRPLRGRCPKGSKRAKDTRLPNFPP